MGQVTHPKLGNIDFERSYITSVIYDDESLTLEMDFLLQEAHPKYAAPQQEGEACFKPGFIRLSALEDLRLAKAKPEAGKEVDYSDIYEATIDGNYVHIHGGWGEIELTAQSIQVAFD